MARKNTPTAAATDPNATAATGTDTGTPADDTSKTRKPRRKPNPEDALYWNGSRDTALVLSLLSAPTGTLTAQAVVERLKAHPAFQGDERLLDLDGTPEKIRQRVKRLNEINLKKGRPPLELKHMSNAGFDAEDNLDRIYASLAQQQVPGAVAGPGVGVISQASPVVPVFSGGLIPTPGT